MMNNNSNNSQNSKGGRKLGSTNKMTPESRKILLEVFKDDFQKLDKLVNYVPFDERFVSLKPYAKILCTGSDEISNETKELIFEGLRTEFTPNKFKSYLNQLEPKKRAIEMRHYLKMLTPKQIEILFKNIDN